MTAHALNRLRERVSDADPLATLRAIRVALEAGTARRVSTMQDGRVSLYRVVLPDARVVYPVVGDRQAVVTVYTPGMTVMTLVGPVRLRRSGVTPISRTAYARKRGHQDHDGGCR